MPYVDNFTSINSIYYEHTMEWRNASRVYLVERIKIRLS